MQNILGFYLNLKMKASSSRSNSKVRPFRCGVNSAIFEIRKSQIETVLTDSTETPNKIPCDFNEQQKKRTNCRLIFLLESYLNIRRRQANCVENVFRENRSINCCFGKARIGCKFITSAPSHDGLLNNLVIFCSRRMEL